MGYQQVRGQARDGNDADEEGNWKDEWRWSYGKAGEMRNGGIGGSSEG